MRILLCAVIFISIFGTASADCWPPGLTTGGIYIIASPSEAIGVFQCIELKDNTTIRVDPSVSGLDLHAHELLLGRNVTIDLSAPRDKPERKRDNTNEPAQPSWGKTGSRGGDGGNGTNGLNGIRLKLVVDKLAPKGSLWIRTDGQPGGDGGNGGKGGPGGGSSCGKGKDEPHTNAGNGGDGGSGGNGGKGGDTSDIELILADYAYAPTTNHDNAPCGPSTRPNSANVDGGTIVVYGQPGCGGNGGEGGQKGETDRTKLIRPCGPFKSDVFPGSDGNSGPVGLAGEAGLIVKPRINDKPQKSKDSK